MRQVTLTREGDVWKRDRSRKRGSWR